jgi:hypothetical protein
MFNDLTALGYGLVVFAVIIGVGTIVLVNFSGSMASCSGTLAGTPVYNHTLELCQNGSNTATPVGPAYTNTAYLTTQMGTSGLAGWTPAIIAISVGLLILGAFIVGGNKNKRRY